ncbi:molybdate ABC transporter substrate-binding protein [Comamonas sp. NLF-1-9]|uniref:molybdate ABC transporter substrate-binding protein n=1 Tax=Comamonas sp. NLF-1-9 TaxID=2853163 RepID=UPI00351D9E7E
MARAERRAPLLPGTTLRRAMAAGALALLAPAAHAAHALVAVAANFSAPMQEIATRFEQQTPHTVSLSFGSTGKFYAQIVHGAPFDVLVSADQATPQRLAREGWAQEATRFTYAIGELVLWSKQAGYVDDGGAVLRQTGWRHLAIANPRLAPYGAAAMQTLQALGLAAELQARIVQGESIAQAWQFAASGNAELAFVARSQVVRDGRLSAGSAWQVPAALHDPLRQDAIVLRQGAANEAAAALLRFLQGEAARAIIHSYGYALP